MVLETRLNLLTREGMVAVIFRPDVSQAAYQELLTITELCHTKEELRGQLQNFAARWKLETFIDD